MKIIKTKYHSLEEVSKRFSLIGSIVRGAIKGAARELEGNSINNNAENLVFGVLVIDRFIDKSRYIGKDYVYEINKDCEVSAKAPGSIIDWDLSEEFEKFDSCPNDWNKFTVRGKAKDGETLDAVLVTEQGKKLNGKVIVEVR